jgi:hypothetical protein
MKGPKGPYPNRNSWDKFVGRKKSNARDRFLKK